MPATGPIPNIVGILDELDDVDDDAVDLDVVDVLDPVVVVVVFEPVVGPACRGVTLPEICLASDSCPETELDCVLDGDSFLELTRSPSRAVANCCEKELVELLEVDALAVKVVSGSAGSCRCIAETMLHSLPRC